MQKIIEHIQPFVVQIATPYATGTGFAVPGSNLVATNEHVIRNCQKTIIGNDGGLRLTAEVVCIDVLHDLAILKTTHHFSPETDSVRFKNEIEIGEKIIACGHPYGLSFSSTFGIISSKDMNVNGISYIMHDAAMGPGNSGGPLVNMDGEIVGLNSSIFRDGKNIGIALHIGAVKEAVDHYLSSGAGRVTRCNSCLQFCEDAEESDDHCGTCGAQLTRISKYPKYTALGLARQIEDIIERLGYDVEICRRGQYSWELIKGSAVIVINYHAKSGYLTAESVLCRIPGENTIDLYRFLLRANYEIQGLTFSVKSNRVLLSLLIYDQYIETDVAADLIRRLLVVSDEYDDLLIDKFSALP